MTKSISVPVSRMAWNFTRLNNDTTEIYIYDVISDKQGTDWWTGEKGTEVTPVSFLDDLNKVATPNICVRINSRGGDVFAAEAIRTAIREKRHEGKSITCKIDGFCGSAAVGVSAACEKTSIPASAWFMIHDPYIFVFGYYGIPEFKKDISMLEKIKQGIIVAYAEKTGKDRREISDLMTAETWYTGEEAVENHFCDELMFEEAKETDPPDDPGNLSLFEVSMYKNIPASLIGRSVLNGGGFSNTKNNKNIKNGGLEKMEIKTVEDLAAAFPGLVGQVAETAAADERKRIKDIEDIALDGFEDIVASAKFDSPAGAAEVAMRIVAEQKRRGADYLRNLKDDVKNSGMDGIVPGGHEGAGGTNPYDAAIDKVLPAVKQ